MRVPQEQQTDARLGISLKQAGHCFPAVRGSETATLFIPRKSKEPKRSHCMHHSLDSIHVDARSRCQPKTLLPNNRDKIPTTQYSRNRRQLITGRSWSDQAKRGSIIKSSWTISTSRKAEERPKTIKAERPKPKNQANRKHQDFSGKYKNMPPEADALESRREIKTCELSR